MLSSSADGTTWSSSTTIPGANSSQPPALAVCQNQLFVAWMGTDKKIYLSSSPNGVTWAPPYSFTIPNGCSCPGLTALNNNLYVTFLDSSTQAVYVATITGAGGQLSSSTVSIGQTALSGNQPAIGTYGSTLYLMFPDTNRNLVYCTSTDGATWVYQGAFGQTTSQSPCFASGAMPQVPRPLLAPPSQVLQLTGINQKVSAISGFSGYQFTLEAWICPSSLNQQQMAILLASQPGSGFCEQLMLTVGGSGGALSLLFFGLQPGFKFGQSTLCTTTAGIAGIAPSVWAHVAATISIANNLSTTVVLYVNGQPVADAGPFDGTAIMDLPLAAGGVISNVQLGSTQNFGGTAINNFQGQMAEVRIWNTARAAADIAALYLSRARGNEPGLLACYRLEDAPQGCLRDITAERGFGQLATGNSIVTAPSLPLCPTNGAAPVSISAMGKLVTEYITQPARFDLSTLTTNSTIGYSYCAKFSPYTDQAPVFDATLQPQALDGRSFAGQAIYLCPDRSVIVFLDQGDFAAQTYWTGGKTYSVIVPPSGKIRVRFLATGLTLPALRVRVDGMQAGVWTTVLPDEGALQSLCNLNANDLAAPADGRSSPLPSSMSADDTNALVSTLNSMQSAVAPASWNDSVPPNMVYGTINNAPGNNAPGWLNWNTIGIKFGASVTPATAAAASAVAFAPTGKKGGFSLSAVTSGITWLGNQIASGTTTWVNDAGSALYQAGSACGSLASAYIDDGTTGLNRVHAVAKRASHLVVSDASALTDLAKAASMAASRVGAQAISDCIQAADTLAVGTDGLLSNGFAIIGTAIVNGTTVVWRVVCTCASDVAAAARALCDRIAADVQKLLDYLAWLLNWDQFLQLADQINGAVNGLIGGLNHQMNALNGYITGLQGVLTLPPSIGNQSLAQACHININQNNPVLKEMEYVIEQAQRLMNSQNLAFDALVSAVTSNGLNLNNVFHTNLSSLSSIGSGLVTTVPSSAALTDPIALVTTPINGLLTSLLSAVTGASADGPTTSPIVNTFFNIVTQLESVVTLGESLLQSHISVPGVTSLIETYILKGRSLTLQYLLSLLAAIPAVIEGKIASGATIGSAPSSTQQATTAKMAIVNNATTQAATTSSSAGVPFQQWAPWFNVSLTAVYSLLFGAQTMLKSQSDASELADAALDLGIGFINAIQASLSFGFNQTAPSSAQPVLNATSSLQLIAAALQMATSGAELYQIQTKASDDAKKTLDLVKTVISGVNFFGQVATTIAIPTQAQVDGTLNSWSTADWTAYAFAAAGLLFQAATELTGKLASQAPGLKTTAVRMAAVNFVVQFAAAIAGAVDDFPNV